MSILDDVQAGIDVVCGIAKKKTLLTKFEALQNQWRLWQWLRDNPNRLKSDWPEWGYDEGEIEYALHGCPSCQYVSDHINANDGDGDLTFLGDCGLLCPSMSLWWNTELQGPCEATDNHTEGVTPYTNWCDASVDGSYRQQSKWAGIIAEGTRQLIIGIYMRGEA